MPVSTLNPPSLAAPLGAYSQAILASGSGQHLYVAGQVGVRADGTSANGFAEQAEVVWQNITSILDAAGMQAAHLVKVVTYVTDATNATALASVRHRFLGEARPAATLVVVQALMRPEWLIEVEAIAFKPSQLDEADHPMHRAPG